MEEAAEVHGDSMQHRKSSPAITSSGSPSNASNTAVNLHHYSPSNFGSDSTRKPGVPPIPPLHTPTSLTDAFHSCSSQPPALSFPPNLSPPPFAGAGSAGMPPPKLHRRSYSDVPVGFVHPCSFSSLLNHSERTLVAQQWPPTSSQELKRDFEWEKETESSADGVSDGKSEGGDTADDLFNMFMNLDNFDSWSSLATEENRDDLERNKLSGLMMNSAHASWNEAESSINESGVGGRKKKEGNKRSAVGDPIPTTARHCRSYSLGSSMEKMNFGNELPNPLPLQADQTKNRSRSSSMHTNTSLDSASGEFTSAEIAKIRSNGKLAELALTDPKKVKRILANRLSAARSKERKMKYTQELELKVQTLQTEATSLSAQLTLIQRDSARVVCHNNELRIRLEAMEQHAKLRDAINEALSMEVQRLKLAIGEITKGKLSLGRNQPLNPEMFQLAQNPHNQMMQPKQEKEQEPEPELEPKQEMQNDKEPEQEMQNDKEPEQEMQNDTSPNRELL
ncbi:putative transcription factor PosF21 [Canna indica]|uniref:Transcription factor PosF21 n=1 Tax=Canna indica TaxID=4628 RepID=A0AAQ3K162_9LILI|nr:putative transcription factor PosF21 [Canna indica]